MIRQETDAALINRVSNMPGVRENISYREGEMDWSVAFPFADTGIVVLSNGKDACVVFGLTGHKIWQAHTMFAPSCRGAEALATAREMLRFMEPYADIIWGATPIKNCAARWFNRQLGAMPIRRDHYEAEGEVEVYEIRMQD